MDNRFVGSNPFMTLWLSGADAMLSLVCPQTGGGDDLHRQDAAHRTREFVRFWNGSSGRRRRVRKSS
ncbi:MAG TPA: hypothetical protein VMV45_09930 [Casimicrobiaceae bacterium]|nr:hypothetical protein [Casimicrobiaceae bacterium]